MVLRFPWGARLVKMMAVAYVSNVDQIEYTLKAYGDDDLTQLLDIQTRVFPALGTPTSMYVESEVSTNFSGTRAVLIEAVRRHPTNPNIAPTRNEVVIDDLEFETAPYDLKLELVGKAIDPANSYAEGTTLRATVVFPLGASNGGMRHDGWTGQITLTENPGTTYYDGTNGASTLPVTVDATNGLATVTVRSVSKTDSPLQGLPLDAFVVGTGTRAVTAEVLAPSNPFAVSQWFDANVNGLIDWLDVQSTAYLTCFKGKGGETGTVAGKVTTIMQLNVFSPDRQLNDCGFTGWGIPLGTAIEVSPWCHADGGTVNLHRTNVDHELSGTIIHEARHSWQETELARNVGTNNDGNAQTPKNDDDPNPLGGDNGDHLAEQVTFSSAQIILESQSGHGDAVYDFTLDGEPGGAPFCEQDARNFESPRKSLCP